ncbi:2-methylcitrate dehydratase PrpD [Zopfia rhizophila CBS 207.26]|uniref:2-methylcitrate dehydratase PrpD n=1 Tax=Zopfia rhizophila CBS 207.26 TaxID=1314779 RepID=A0A6A6EM06_9PEZI|nr:2-methylcitrate dehydratase PrpD [Zopfia rhizophila CBS 207.26]
MRLHTAHLEGFGAAVNAVIGIEESRECHIWGWEKTLPPLTAASLNGTFIPSFELHDWHDSAPLHSNSILLLALFAAAEHKNAKSRASIPGSDLLLSTISAGIVEDALGIACTQAGDLIMQHGFAARNGLCAALLAKGGYVGIKGSFPRAPGKDPPYLIDEVCKAFGNTWQLEGIRVKKHSAMAGTHCMIECIAALQDEYPDALIELGEWAFDHGGWGAKRPLNGDSRIDGGQRLMKHLEAPKSIPPGLSNQDILEKWRAITVTVIDDEKRRKIENVVLHLEGLDDLAELAELLKGKTANSIAR